MVRGMARLYTARGPARADFGEALAVARAAGDRLVLGVALEHYGVLLCLDGDPDRASALHQEMLTIARSLDDENLRAEAHYVLAVDALADGDVGSAAPHLAAAIRHYQNLGHFEGLTRCLAALSALALQHRDPHLAARLIGTAAEVRDRFPTPGLADAVRAHARAAKDALAPWHASYNYYNFAETPAGASAVLPRHSYHRLQKIKAAYDPDQAIIATHPVWPARY